MGTDSGLNWKCMAITAVLGKGQIQRMINWSSEPGDTVKCQLIPEKQSKWKLKEKKDYS